MNDLLLVPRRLAIQILHEAQIAQPASMHGWVYERGGKPAVFRLAAADMGTHRADENLWARLWSKPTSPAVPTPAELREGLINLVVSLNTKGVLEMRAWELLGNQAVERELRVED
ncbi:MAG: hypothetical protein JWQ90_2257 [Hydrocarboniphaga sp.]|uniref:hypothetical protein n=1 Tax=Hydrocarboniphaga sp. TaxID=2033016 RepID=UPI00262594A2|nr:hypothetical protein [Hydrocarboniphaga sp.]MDB5969807.1 hypothetical protein [Hydrocarboniphaga sp.]